MATGTKSTTPTRQPSNVGPDVIYLPDEETFAAYLDGRCIATNPNSQEAWVAARSAYHAPVETSVTSASTSVVTITREVCGEMTHITYQVGDVELCITEDASEPTGLEPFGSLSIGNRDGLAATRLRDLYQLLQLPMLQRWMAHNGTSCVPPIVAVVHIGNDPIEISDLICEDRLNRERFGKPESTDFCIGTGATRVELRFPDYDIYQFSDINVPDVFSPTLADSFPAEAFAAMLTNATRLFSDPRVQQARKRWWAGLHPVPTTADGYAAHPTAPPDMLPVVATPHICDDPLDEAFGKQNWTDFACGTDSTGHPTEFSIYEPDVAGVSAACRPWLFAFGEDGWSLDEVDRVLPQINALMSNPTVQAARARWETAREAAGVPAEPESCGVSGFIAKGEEKTYIQGYADGYERGRINALKDLQARLIARQEAEKDSQD